MLAKCSPDGSVRRWSHQKGVAGRGAVIAEEREGQFRNGQSNYFTNVIYSINLL